MRPAFLTLILATTLLTACGNKTNDDDKNLPPETQTKNDAPAVDVAAAPSDDTSSCGSLKPLLKLLPTQHEVSGSPEVTRNCDTSQYSVSVIYATEGDKSVEYHYSAAVLDGNSPYVESLVNMNGATPDQQDFFRKSVTAIGQMFHSQFDICKNYFASPMIPDGRNPVVKAVNGVEICVMDNLDTNKEIWNVYALYKNNIGLKLELNGAKAAELTTAEAAAAYLSPLFGLFNTGVEL